MSRISRVSLDLRPRVILVFYLNLRHDTSKLVFHFAKREETKRITSVLEIALLLERVRDAFLVDKDSLLSVDGNLSYHVVNDIDTTLRVWCNLIASAFFGQRS